MNEMKLRILLAEGNPGEAASALRMLYPEGQDGLELTNVSSVSTLIATLEIVNPEVIFLDLALAHSDPLDAVRRVHRSASAVPLIVLADASDKDCAARSLSQGALNYLIKGFIDTRTLERVLRAALERNTLEGLADLLRDSLTGLYIREGFLTLGERAMETAKRSESTLVLLCMSIENLAALRAGYGFQCRREIATRGSHAPSRQFPPDGHHGPSWRVAICGTRRRRSGAQRTGAPPAFGKAHRRAQSRHGFLGSARTSHECAFLVTQGGDCVF